MKKILAFLLAAGMACSFVSCNENNNNSENSVSESQQAAENPNIKISPADSSFTIKPASGTSYTTDDGRFKFNIDDTLLSEYDGNESSKYNFAFSLRDENTLIGVKSIPDAHQDVKAHSEDMQAGFENVYKDVEGNSIDINGIPAYEIHFDYNTKGFNSKFGYIAAQYGNGDIIAMVYAVPEEDAEIAEEQIRNMLASIEYLGSPLKTEPEKYENDYFEITIDKDMYFQNKDEKSVAIRPNIAEDAYEQYCSLQFEAFDSKTAKALADEDKKFYDESKDYANISIDNSKILGYDAIHIKVTAPYPEMTLIKESYYFEFNGKTYRILYYTPDKSLENFKKKTQSAIDSITLK